MEVRVIISIIVMGLGVGVIIAEALWRDALDQGKFIDETDDFYHLYMEDFKPVPMKYYWCTLFGVATGVTIALLSVAHVALD